MLKAITKATELAGNEYSRMESEPVWEKGSFKPRLQHNYGGHRDHLRSPLKCGEPEGLP